MLLKKIHLTDDEARQYEELESFIKDLMETFSGLPYLERQKAAAAYRDAADKQHAIIAGAENRYVASIMGNYDAIMSAVREALDAYTKEDYKEAIAEMRNFTRAEIALIKAQLKAAKTDEEKKSITAKLMEQQGIYSNFFSYNYESARAQLQEVTELEATALAKSDFSLDEYNNLVNEKATSFYLPRRGKKKPVTYVDDLLSDGYIAMPNSPMTDDLMRITKRDIRFEGNSKFATFKLPGGSQISIVKHNDMGSLSVSMQKLLDTASVYLCANNYYGGAGKNVNPTVRIPLIEYAAKNRVSLTPRKMATPEEQEKEDARVADRKKKFKQYIQRDLKDLAAMSWTGTIIKGRNAGNYSYVSYISSHSIREQNDVDFIIINFDIDAATHLLNSYMMWYPSALLAIDNRKATTYKIGVRIAKHNSNDNNVASGTNNTLSVRSLLEAATDLPSYEDITARGQRNWRNKIKLPLERALDDLMDDDVRYLSKWEYRDPRTGTTYTSETAQPLAWEQYNRLMVDFTVIDPPASTPAQIERRKKRAIERAKAAAVIGEPKQKGSRRKAKNTLPG